MKPVKAWAVLNERGNMEFFDFRPAVTFLRRMAAQYGMEHGVKNPTVVRVEIRELPKKAKR